MAGQIDQRFTDELRTFVAWVDGKQNEDAEAQPHIDWLVSHGYTVSKA
jgi:hypothetical protein